jgi:hypothetical protein
MLNIFSFFTLVFSLYLTPQPTNSSAFVAPLNKMAEPLDVSGHWEGTITSDEGGGKRTIFEFQIDLNQKKEKITGISYVKYSKENKDFFARMELVGKVKKNYVKFLEKQILAQDSIPNTEWCLKMIELTHKMEAATPVLEGLWEGFAGGSFCRPGRIRLQKKAPKV